MYKVALRGSSVFIGKLYPTLAEARKIQKDAGSEYHIYEAVSVKKKYGKITKEWRKVE